MKHNHIEVVRGQNPEPEEGWSWALSEYEVQYVREFNARPPRNSVWSADTASEIRLEREAEGVREVFRGHKKRKRRWPLVPVVFVIGLLTIGTGVTATLGYLDYQETKNVMEQVQSVEGQLND